MFKLTLRELFLLVLAAAVGCGWWVHHSHEAKERAKSEYLLRYDIEMLLLQRNSWQRKYEQVACVAKARQDRADTRWMEAKQLIAKNEKEEREERSRRERERYESNE
jgi:hypothetical protein